MLKLSPRLNACASLVREGARLADIGCDHGYVPVALTEQGKIEYAVACDINEGPLSACRALVRDYGYQEKIRCALSDGLDAVGEEEASDILIAGMGGELIAALLSRCPYLHTKHLILNPMTHPELARKWLFENGFTIQNDIIVSDAGHHYSVFDAYYTGEYPAFTETDCFLGKIGDYSDKEYFIHLIRYLKNKEKGGADYAAVLAEIYRRASLDNG